MSVTALVTAEVAKLVPTLKASAAELLTVGAKQSIQSFGRHVRFNPSSTTLKNDGQGKSVELSADKRDTAHVQHQMQKTKQELTRLQPQQRNPYMMGKRPALMPRVQQNPFRARILSRADAVVGRNTPRPLRRQIGMRMRMLKEAEQALTARPTATVGNTAISTLSEQQGASQGVSFAAVQQAMNLASAPAQRSARTKSSYSEMMKALTEPVPSAPRPTNGRHRDHLHTLAA